MQTLPHLALRTWKWKYACEYIPGSENPGYTYDSFNYLFETTKCILIGLQNKNST